MSTLKKLPELPLWEQPLDSGKIPEIDLYMDQLLSLIEEKGITKTMINNYSKEKLIKPLKGKKYSKEQIVQILCIANLKQTLALSDVKNLMPQEDGALDFHKVYDVWAAENDRLEKAAAEFVKTQITGHTGFAEAGGDGEDSAEAALTREEKALAAAMMLSSCCIYFRNLCNALAGED